MTTRAPRNSATCLQVTCAVMAGVLRAMRNPKRGLVEPDDLHHAEILALCRPLLGDAVGEFSDWTPLKGRNRLLDEQFEAADPRQFCNFRVG